MAAKKKTKKSPARKAAPKKAKKAKKDKGPTKAEVKAGRLADMVKEARGERAKNKNLIRDIRRDPGLADEVKALLCADLVRVSKISRAILGPSSGRDRYREMGYYTTALVPLLFGMWAEFQRKAGLKSSLATTTVLRNVSKTSRAQDVANYAESSVRPWDGAYNKLKIGTKRFQMLVISDLHSRYCNPFALRVAHDINKWLQPAAIRVNGDLVDFPQLSTHRQMPGHFPMSMQDEIHWATGKVLAPLRRNNPKADIKYLLGNHDMRLVYALADRNPDFGPLDDLNFAQLFKLDELEIGLVCRANFLAPSAKMRKVDNAENWETLFTPDGRPLFTTVHGFLCGPDAPDKHLRRFMTNGTNGHLHNEKHVTAGSYATGVLDWWQTSTMAHPQAIAAGYIPGPPDATGWTCGGSVFTLDPETCTVQGEHFRVFEDVAYFRDRVWKIRQSERDQIQEMMQI